MAGTDRFHGCGRPAAAEARMTTVLIWNNHQAHLTRRYDGHASMSIDDDWLEEDSYVSWWGIGQENWAGSLSASVKKEVSSDLQAEGYAPDHVIRITGLNESAMQSKWQQIAGNKKRYYNYVRNNCSTIVSQVLKAGTSKGDLTRYSIVWTPLAVKRLAKAIGGQTIGWSDFLDELTKADYLNKSDNAILRNLYKRDEKHGKGGSVSSFYYSGGRSVSPKNYLEWGSGFYTGKNAEGNEYFYAESSSIVTYGRLGASGIQDGEEIASWNFGSEDGEE
jgi:hypothetical protein